MAVKDESLYHATEALILPTPPKYYRAHMYANHWQLRSLISSPKQHIVYYPSGTDIYRLNTRTREREIVTALPFSPRCLTASKGWVCCGGDHGNYTAICLGNREGNQDFAVRLDVDPDARLPLDLDPSRRSTPAELSLASRRSRGHDTPLAKVTKIGSDIVNCVTIWYPPSDGIDSTYKVPVAVLSNNDHKVYIVDLEESEVLESLSFPDCVNRALMSPDGQLLIAISDDPFLYLYRRTQSQDIVKKRFESKEKLKYEWTQYDKIQLEGQRESDATKMRGSFAASFSRSGRYLAVATQYGIISIFDTHSLTQEDADPLVAVFTTSRPNREAGAVRAIEFSPDPLDLLAWTEDSGRVGVADVRDLFHSRQVIMVDSSARDVERVVVLERPASTTLDYLGLDFERRQLRYLTREMLDRHQISLPQEETEVLEALQVYRRQRDAARDAPAQAQAQAQNTTASRWGPWTDGQRSTAASAGSTNAERSTAADRDTSTTGLPTSLREFVSADRSTAPLRAFINERNQDRERRGQQPRRRGSMILAAAQNNIERESREALRPRSVTRSNDNDASSARDHLTLTPSRLPAVGSDSPNNPWAEIEALNNIAVDPPVDMTTRLQIEVEAEGRRDFAQRLRQPWRGLEEGSQLRLGGRYEDGVFRGGARSRPDETMGCCWSEDGRILYVGAEDGIYEYHVNVPGRKIFPSLVLR